MGTVSPKTEGISLLAQTAFVLGAAVLVYSFVSVAKEGELRRRCTPLCALGPEYAAADRTVPSFSLTGLLGETISMESLRGKVVVLNLWSTTCPPCLKEMPMLAELTHVLKDRNDAVVVTITADESIDEIRSTLKSILKGDPPFPVLMDRESKVVAGKFGTRLFPETWLIDKRGVIRARFDHAADWSNPVVVELIDQLRNGSYCPVRVELESAGQEARRRYTGEAASFCEKLSSD